MPNSASQNSVKVLYVDDDVALVRFVQKALGRRGYDVVHAASAEQAFALIAEGDIEVVALDHYLSTGTGLDFLADLSKIEDAPAVVYVTGSSEMNVAVAALKAGAADFLPKTVGDDFLVLLISALEQAVEKSRLRAQKEAADQDVRIAKERAEVLLAEVNHRVANSLSLVTSLISLQSKSIDNQAAKDALAEIQARIFAISLVHKRLYSSGDVRVVALDEYLSSLLDQLSASIRSEGHGALVTYDLEKLTLRTDASINLGVIVAEWVTNAFKYAYPDRKGDIRVRLARLPDEHVELVVEDDGIGRSSKTSAKGTGLGTRIVKAMAMSMGADIQYLTRNPGTAARLTFSLQPE